MTTVVRMPKLADTLVDGTLSQWLKHVGDPIEQGEPLAAIETDKVTTELTSPGAGVLLEVLVGEGQTVPIETPIARIGAAEEAPVAPPPVPSPAPSAIPPPTPSAPSETPPPNVLARKPTPVAARLLAEHGLTADQVPAATDRLKRDDVLAFLATPRASVVQLTPMRRAIAEHMSRARQSIPHGQTVMAADLTDLVLWRTTQTAPVTFTVLFVRALARSVRSLVEPPVDIGVAVALDGGLVVPVVRRADQLSLEALSQSIADLAQRARASQLTPDETQSARMTLTNVGSFGNLTAAPIIPLGQLGILGPGLVERRPMPTLDGGIRPGWRCLLSFVFDRRALSDLESDRFLRSVVDELSVPPAV